jgi:hypothetical protein
MTKGSRQCGREHFAPSEGNVNQNGGELARRRMRTARAMARRGRGGIPSAVHCCSVNHLCEFRSGVHAVYADKRRAATDRASSGVIA